MRYSAYYTTRGGDRWLKPLQVPASAPPPRAASSLPEPALMLAVLDLFVDALTVRYSLQAFFNMVSASHCPGG
jgi:hypothetical protein